MCGLCSSTIQEGLVKQGEEVLCAGPTDWEKAVPLR